MRRQPEFYPTFLLIAPPAGATSVRSNTRAVISVQSLARSPIAAVSLSSPRILLECLPFLSHFSLLARFPDFKHGVDNTTRHSNRYRLRNDLYRLVVHPTPRNEITWLTLCAIDRRSILNETNVCAKGHPKMARDTS